MLLVFDVRHCDSWPQKKFYSSSGLVLGSVLKINKVFFPSRVILYFARLVVLPQVNEHCSAGFAWETLVDSSIPRNKSYASVQVFRSRSNIARQS